MIHHGDCLDVMAAMEPESIDAICTDPPYGLGFMGQAWDKHGMERRVAAQHSVLKRQAGGQAAIEWQPAAFQAWSQRWAEAAYRVAKPSAYLLAFGGTRTVHRMTVALEDAGWIIRDMLVWAYASGFPKSKASLKPAWEPIVMARKPGPLRMLAIDSCRIPFVSDEDREFTAGRNNWGDRMWDGPAAIQVGERPVNVTHEQGRWPANVVLTDGIFDGGILGVVGGGWTQSNDPGITHVQAEGWGHAAERRNTGYGGDSGTYSRFFLIPKADRSDREPVLGGLTERNPFDRDGPSANFERMGSLSKPRANVHPTVKPTELMRHLVRLVTPVGGTVLDCFAGSGSTLIAAEQEGFTWIGIEREREYVDIIEARLNGTQRGLGLVS